MIISYENYETSFGEFHKLLNEMTTLERYCLSYDPLNGIFIAFKLNIISMREREMREGRFVNCL